MDEVFLVVVFFWGEREREGIVSGLGWVGSGFSGSGSGRLGLVARIPMDGGVSGAHVMHLRFSKQTHSTRRV